MTKQNQTCKDQKEKHSRQRVQVCQVMEQKDQSDEKKRPDHVRICKPRKAVWILFQGSPLEGNRSRPSQKAAAEVGTILGGVRGQSGKRVRGGEKDAQQDSSQYSPHLQPQGNAGLCFQGKGNQKNNSSSLEANLNAFRNQVANIKTRGSQM